MSWLTKLGKAIITVVEEVATVVETVVETVAEAASGVVETIGTAATDAIDEVGNWLGGAPVIGGFLQGGVHWLATVVSASFDLLATTIKAPLDLAANVTGGLIRIVGGGIGGAMAGDSGLFVKGIGDISSGIAGALIFTAAKVLAVVQATFFLQLGERRLTRIEHERLWRIYRNSIDLNNTRVIDGWTFLSLADRAPTIGNRIYMGGSANTGVHGSLYDKNIVHECCHVWQYKHIGTRYTADCMWAWATQPGQGYDWQDYYRDGIRVWQDFNTEAQAKFIEDVFLAGTQLPAIAESGEFFKDDPIGPAVEFKSGNDNYTDFARVSMAYVRSHRWFVATP